MNKYSVAIHNCRYVVKDIPAQTKAEARDKAFEFLMAMFGLDYTDHKVLKIRLQN